MTFTEAPLSCNAAWPLDNFPGKKAIKAQPTLDQKTEQNSPGDSDDEPSCFTLIERHIRLASSTNSPPNCDNPLQRWLSASFKSKPWNNIHAISNPSITRHASQGSPEDKDGMPNNFVPVCRNRVSNYETHTPAEDPGPMQRWLHSTFESEPWNHMQASHIPHRNPAGHVDHLAVRDEKKVSEQDPPP